MALPRDWRRYRALASLPSGPIAIAPEAGFALAPSTALPLVPEVVEQAHAALARFDTAARASSKKRFLVNVLPDHAHTLDEPIVRFALHPDVLAPVSRYLGMVPLLTAVRVFHSDTTEGVPTSSQLYHLDADDVTQVKIFVYCTDVDPRSGPLTIVGASDTQRLQRRLQFHAGGRVADADVQAADLKIAEHAVIGPSGTSVFVDTSRCLHYGSRVAPDAPARLVLMVQYSTPYSFMVPRRYQDAAPLRHLAGATLTPVQRMVLGE